MTGGNRSQSTSQAPSGPIETEQLLSILDKVTKRLKEGTGGSGTKFPRVLAELKESDLRDIFTHLRDVLSAIITDSITTADKVSTLETECGKANDQVNLVSVKLLTLEKKSRVQSDLIDHHHQRSLRGKFTISPLAPFKLSQREELEQRNESLPAYVCSLIRQKYSIEPSESDIFACRLTKKGLSFRLSNLSPNSLYGDLVKLIKTGQGSTVRGFFFNFALTPKRAALMYELRQAKKAKKIDKLYSNSDGTVSFIPLSSSSSSHNSSRGSRDKFRITSIFIREDDGSIHLRTYSPQELRDELGIDPNSESSVNTSVNTSN